jgi:hypothetical protein
MLALRTAAAMEANTAVSYNNAIICVLAYDYYQLPNTLLINITQTVDCVCETVCTWQHKQNTTSSSMVRIQSHVRELLPRLYVRRTTTCLDVVKIRAKKQNVAMGTHRSGTYICARMG